MRIVIAGGTGFLGGALASALAADGHDISVLTRGLPPGVRAAPEGPSQRITRIGWTPDGTAGAWGAAVNGAHAVINLAGESIGERRWSQAQKAKIHQSRVLATRSLATAIRGASQAPGVFISGSAVGYYGSRGDERLTEGSGPGSDFLAGVCVDWEKEAGVAASAHTRVAYVRTGLVLARDGGALPRMLLPFRVMAGGPLGSGDQYMSWIHRDDWVALVTWLVHTNAAAGAFNATSPEPVPNTVFMRTLGRVMRRPSWLPAPAFALRLALGEMADALLLSSQRAVPARAQQTGFRFAYSDLEPALRSALS